jgi:hypothetical protein
MAQSEKVIISVELRDKGVTTGTNKAKDSIDGLTAAQKRLKKAAEEATFQESQQGRELADLQVKAQLAAKANKELAISTMNASKATKEGKTQTGLNNAILVEAGRAASDAQYGMQGMANNIGQLATLMGQHAQTQGGFVASFKTLAGSLLGSGGVLIALQLLISFLPKIQKYFEELTESVDDFNNSLSLSTDNLTLISKKLFDANLPLKERNTLLKVLKKTDKEVYDVLTKGNKTAQEQKDILDKYIESKKKENEQSEIGKKLSEEINKTQEEESKLRDVLSGKAVKDSNFYIRRLKEFEEGTVKSIKGVKENSRAFDALYESEFRRVRSLAEQERGNFQGELDSLLDKRRKFNDKYLELQKEIVSLRSEIGLDEDKRDKSPVEQLYGTMIGDTETSLNALLNAQDEGQNKLIQSRVDWQRRLEEIEEGNRQKRIEKALEFAGKLKEAQNVLGDIAGLATGFIDAEIQAEQAKTVKINNELRERLNNENLSAEERKKIQLKIAGNDAASAKKKDKLAEKQFKIDKALRISGALVETYSSAVRAYASQLIPFDPTSIVRAKIAAGVATGFGLANVAMIAKQKFVPSATSAPALDTGGASSTGAASAQPPSFNIVGSSNINQLSDAISEAEKAPTRTYVVASDVSTAQELDRNIIESASL